MNPCDLFNCNMIIGCPEEKCCESDECPFWDCLFCEGKDDCKKYGITEHTNDVP